MNNTIWIIGSGPSLKDIDVSKLSDRPTIAFNRSYIAWDEWGFVPTHYCVIDMRVMKSIKADLVDIIEAGKCDVHLNDDTYDGFSTRDLPLITPETSIYELGDKWGFDPDHPYYCGDVGAFSLQIAYQQGYRRAAIVGVDLRWEDRPNLNTDELGPRTALTGDDINHFRPDYYPPGFEYSHPFPDGHFSAWRKASKEAKEWGMEIVNAGSPNSRLNELVPYIPFEEALTW